MAKTKIFISYNRRDNKYKERLLKHLNPLEREGHLIIWHDGKIKTGESWPKKIKEELHEADAAVLLISADFLASDYIMKNEVKTFLERKKMDKNFSIFPLLIYDCDIDRENWLKELQVRTHKNKPLAALSAAKIETALLEFAKEIDNIISGNNDPSYLKYPVTPHHEKLFISDEIDKFRKDFVDKNLYIDINGMKRIPKKSTEKTEEKYESIVYNPLDKFIEKWLRKNDSNCLVILGEYGTGKTTFLRHIAHKLDLNRLKPGSAVSIPDKKRQIPLLFSLHNFRNDMESFIKDQLRNRGIEDISFYEFVERVRDGEFIILLDGFNEMTPKINNNESCRAFAEICKLLDSSPKSKIILTARQEYFQAENDLREVFMSGEDRNIDFVYLLPFSDIQIKTYLQAHTDNNIYYLKIIKKEFDLNDLVKRPSLLRIISRYLKGFENKNDDETVWGLTINTAVLYEHCIRNELIRKKIPLNINYRNRLEILEKLAIRAFFRNTFGFDTGIFENEPNFSNCFTTEGKWEFEELRNEFLTYSLLIRKADNCYSISHKSFRDYLTASLLYKEIITGKVDNFPKFKLTDNKNVNNFICELPILRDSLIDLVKYSQNLPEKKKWQGTNAASILNRVYKTWLKGEDISFRELSNVDFRKIDLTGTNIEGTNLVNCRFDENIFDTVNFDRAILDKSSLHLYNAGIPDFSKINNLRCLKEIDLSNNRIENISFLKKQKSLKCLWLSGNKIEKLSHLKGLKNLTELVLSDNEIKRISPLKKLINLTKLVLRDNKIKKVSQLKGLKNLEVLDLTGNPVETGQIDKLRKALPGCKISFQRRLHENEI